jgi:arginyl-tRNA synthetase
VTAPKPALRHAIEAEVRRLGVDEVPDLELGRARSSQHGDYSSSVAMKLARQLRRPPPEIAAQLATRLDLAEAQTEAVGGYLNFRLRPGWLRELVATAASDEAYGCSQLGGGERVQAEFLSTNPTGPLHIGHGRGAVLGDVLCRLLTFTGHDVQREYYVNDFGNQARLFGESLYARLTGQEPPENGYVGEYVNELAKGARQDIPGLEAMSRDKAVDALREFGVARVVEQFQQTVSRLGVEYDSWYSEKSLWDDELPQRAIERLQRAGLLVERDGAVWFAPALGDSSAPDEERVVRKRDGGYTYFASDLGYLLSRFEVRGFQRVIEVWGSDHHGYVPRMKAAAAALGIDPDRLVVILNQLVNLKEGKVSRRLGRFVTLDELIDRVGPDAVRYFYLLRSPEAMMEFDLELAVSQGSENPVYYAQYAHARLFNVERTAAETHRQLPEVPDLALLDKPWELAVAREVAFWPEAVETAAERLEPHRLPHYVQDLADRVHAFYHAGNDVAAYRVVVPDPELTRARLELARAARNTLRIALGLIGVSAPERM